jgi:hypothetical protein
MKKWPRRRSKAMKKMAAQEVESHEKMAAQEVESHEKMAAHDGGNLLINALNCVCVCCWLLTSVRTKSFSVI